MKASNITIEQPANTLPNILLGFCSGAILAVLICLGIASEARQSAGEAKAETEIIQSRYSTATNDLRFWKEASDRSSGIIAIWKNSYDEEVVKLRKKTEELNSLRETCKLHKALGDSYWHGSSSINDILTTMSALGSPTNPNDPPTHRTNRLQRIWPAEFRINCRMEQEAQCLGAKEQRHFRHLPRQSWQAI